MTDVNLGLPNISFADMFTFFLLIKMNLKGTNDIFLETSPNFNKINFLPYVVMVCKTSKSLLASNLSFVLPMG